MATTNVTTVELTRPTTIKNLENTTKSTIKEPKVVSNFSSKKSVPVIIVVVILGVLAFLTVTYLVFRYRSKRLENFQDSAENSY